jgi:hypothetical protein
MFVLYQLSAMKNKILEYMLNDEMSAPDFCSSKEIALLCKEKNEKTIEYKPIAGLG